MAALQGDPRAMSAVAAVGTQATFDLVFGAKGGKTMVLQAIAQGAQGAVPPSARRAAP